VSQQGSGPSEPEQGGLIAIGRAGLTKVDFRKARFDTLQIEVANFVACDFRGLRLADRFQPFFATRPRSVFTACRFEEADLRDTSPEGTRFERCVFDDARLNGWAPARAEFVGCRFAGTLAHVTFTGRPAGPGAEWIDPPRARNEFRGNDFRGAELLDTVFVLGIDLDAQLWPAGEDYVRLDRFPERVERVQTEVLGWDEGEARRAALVMLRTLAHRWQAQSDVVAMRVSPAEKAPPRLQYRLWRLLERARLGPTLGGT